MLVFSKKLYIYSFFKCVEYFLYFFFNKRYSITLVLSSVSSSINTTWLLAMKICGNSDKRPTKTMDIVKTDSWIGEAKYKLYWGIIELCFCTPYLYIYSLVVKYKDGKIILCKEWMCIIPFAKKIVHLKKDFNYINV